MAIGVITGLGLPFTNVLLYGCVDDTQDQVEDEQQLARVKDWIISHHLDTIELTDVLSNFPDISVVRAASSFFFSFKFLNLNKAGKRFKCKWQTNSIFRPDSLFCFANAGFD
jgi:hypothetical protein